MRRSLPSIVIIFLLMLIPTSMQAQETTEQSTYDDEFFFVFPADWNLQTASDGAVVLTTPEDHQLLLLGPTYFANQSYLQDVTRSVASYSIVLSLLNYAHETVPFSSINDVGIIGKEFITISGTIQAFLFRTDGDMDIMLIATTNDDSYDQNFTNQFLQLANSMNASFVPIRSADEPVSVATITSPPNTTETQNTDDVDTAATEPEPTNEPTSSPTPEPSVTINSCRVLTEFPFSARVRLGPSFNRAAIVFLDANTEYQPLSQTEDANGQLWYKLDPEIVAPGKDIEETWVHIGGLLTTGNCDELPKPSATIENYLACDLTGLLNGYAGLPVYEFSVVAGEQLTLEVAAGEYFYSVRGDCLDVTFDVGITKQIRLVHGEETGG